MAYRVTEECINCGACEPECPNNAIYEGGAAYELNGATSTEGSFFSNDYFYIVSEKCTECVGFHDEPQCVSVCPVDAVVKL
ncbi:MAG TPA: 4Fe-4S binding protein [Ignavibacteriaceae bacterium]|nr:4Fe-4S binding protein [Ignavibacteriaceae bacterium]